ncbi:MAG: hemolysin family protein [Lachnospiraceae bacterium]|nr:hemolysin family protein [Lachnospiraceae bacterium]
MDTDGVIQLFIIIVLVSLAAFFSFVETAFTAVNKIRLKSLSEDGNKRAQTALNIKECYSKMLSAILIGNTIVNLSASAMATALAIRIGGNVAAGIATGILTIVIILGAEIMPKTLANMYSERIALRIAFPVSVLIRIMIPIIFLVDKIAFFILKLMRVDSQHKEVMTEKELKSYLDVGHEDGAIETDERTMINNVFEFGDTFAQDVMIPRIDMTVISADAGYDETLNIINQNMFTRLPVYRDNKDVIVGLINIKDLFSIADERRETFRAEDILRTGYFTHELKKTDDLMMELRDKAMNMAFVLDEYGLTVGMITLEDLLEEIVGEIRDEYDEDEKEMIKNIEENTYLIEGKMKLDDVNDALGTKFKSEDYDSIGGLMIEFLVRLPEENEIITTADGITLQAKEIVKNRITNVILTLPKDENIEEVLDIEENRDIISEEFTFNKAEKCEEPL